MNDMYDLVWGLEREGASLLASGMDEKSKFRGRVVMIPVSMIDSKGTAIRKDYDEVGILALANSIRLHGLLQPILVKKTSKGVLDKSRYLCIAGERRLRAFQMLSRGRIPCFVLPETFSDLEKVALLDNLVKKDLNAFEIADTFDFLMKNHGMTPNEIAATLSISRTFVENTLLLLEFTSDERKVLLQNQLSERFAPVLLRIPDCELRKRVLELIVERDYTVKHADEYVDTILQDSVDFVSISDEDESFLEGSLNKYLTWLMRKGFAVQVEQFDHTDETQVLIRIPKK